jgi:DnaK suppressor protein
MTTTLHPVLDSDPDGTRARLLGLHLQLSAEIEEARAQASVAGDGSDRAGDDEIDVGSRTSLQEQELGILATIRGRLTQVERALARLDAGRYGMCEGCQEPIPAERLEVFPSATECLRCKQLRERRV